MARIRLTLQNRISTIMVVSTIILISVFTVIQLNKHLSNLSLYNSYQARLSAMLAKNSLQDALKSLPPGENQIGPHLQKTLDYIAEIKLIDKAIIADENDKIIASTDNKLLGRGINAKDMVIKYNLTTNNNESKLFELKINKAERLLDIFIPLNNPVDQKAKLLVKLTSSIGNIKDAIMGIYKDVILTSILVVLANIVIGFLLSKTVIGPIKILNEATKVIANGNLETRVSINTDDELEELATTFNEMATALIKMKERAENANPLTKLPGNIVIQEDVERRIRQGEKFMVVHVDLNNFKAYNDCYGLSKGDEAIKLTAQILKEALEIKGNKDDLLGHEGGDDFILATTPEKAHDICAYITSQFDTRIKDLYNADDLKRGFIVAESRQGAIMQFPIMSISLSGVTNERRNVQSYREVTNIAAEVKKKAKAAEKSIFIVDQRAM